MDFEVYCDESRPEYFSAGRELGADRFVTIGGLWIEARRRNDFKAAIQDLRETHDVHGEFKWNRVSPSRLTFYTRLIDYFFQESMRFRSIVLPANQLDAVTFHEGDTELMFYKFYYLLLQGWIYDFNKYRIFLDVKTSRVRSRLGKLQEVLGASNVSSEILAVQALPSHEVDLLQFADVLIGAIGAKFNGDTTSEAKAAVINAIEKNLRARIQPTSKGEEKFNIFRFRPGGGW